MALAAIRNGGFASERQDAEANIPVIQSRPLRAAAASVSDPHGRAGRSVEPSDYDNTFFLNRADRSDFPPWHHQRIYFRERFARQGRSDVATG